MMTRPDEVNVILEIEAFEFFFLIQKKKYSAYNRIV